MALASRAIATILELDSILESARALELAPVVGGASVLAMCYLGQTLVGVKKKAVNFAKDSTN